MMDSIEAANAALPGSPDAKANAARALFELVMQLAPSLPAAAVGRLDTNASPREQRAQWIEVLKLLDDAMAFPSLHDLIIDLEELDRGITSERLTCKKGGRRGGLSGTSELAAMREIVEAADALRDITGSDLDYRAALEGLGSAYSTIEDYRRKLSTGPEAYRQPRSYVLAHGLIPPADLLQSRLRLLLAVRKNSAQRREIGA